MKKRLDFKNTKSSYVPPKDELLNDTGFSTPAVLLADDEEDGIVDPDQIELDAATGEDDTEESDTEEFDDADELSEDDVDESEPVEEEDPDYDENAAEELEHSPGVDEE